MTTTATPAQKLYAAEIAEREVQAAAWTEQFRCAAEIVAKLVAR